MLDLRAGFLTFVIVILIEGREDVAKCASVKVHGDADVVRLVSVIVRAVAVSTAQTNLCISYSSLVGSGSSSAVLPMGGAIPKRHPFLFKSTLALGSSTFLSWVASIQTP